MTMVMMMDTKKEEKVSDRLPFPFPLQVQGYNDGTKEEEILTSARMMMAQKRKKK